MNKISFGKLGFEPLRAYCWRESAAPPCAPSLRRSGTGSAVISVDDIECTVDDMEEGVLRTRVELQGRRRDEAKKPPGIRGLSKKEVGTR